MNSVCLPISTVFRSLTRVSISDCHRIDISYRSVVWYDNINCVKLTTHLLSHSKKFHRIVVYEGKYSALKYNDIIVVKAY